jgi:hypothetical protein
MLTDIEELECRVYDLEHEVELLKEALTKLLEAK